MVYRYAEGRCPVDLMCHTVRDPEVEVDRHELGPPDQLFRQVDPGVSIVNHGRLCEQQVRRDRQFSPPDGIGDTEARVLDMCVPIAPVW